jgi:hypothetical protein
MNSVKSITKKVLLRRFGTENYHDEVVVKFSLLIIIYKQYTITRTSVSVYYSTLQRE